MTYYRLYFLDRFSGRIDHFRGFEAAGDAEAVGQAGEWRELAAMELWSGGRKVRSWAAQPLSPELRARSAVTALRSEMR